MRDKRECLEELHKILESFIEKCFPKKCDCGKTYANLQEFLSQTEEATASGSLLEPGDYEGTTAIDLLRNCTCGSTIMVAIYNRRDMSEDGIRLRKRFGQLLDELTAAGIEPDAARRELVRTLCGKDSEIEKDRT